VPLARCRPASGSGGCQGLSSPISKGEGTAELLDALVMGGVACDKFQTIPDCNRRNHRVTATDGATNPVEIAGDQAGQVGGVLVEKQDFPRE
jgi:hypothetical protein